MVEDQSRDTDEEYLYHRPFVDLDDPEEDVMVSPGTRGWPDESCT